MTLRLMPELMPDFHWLRQPGDASASATLMMDAKRLWPWRLTLPEPLQQPASGSRTKICYLLPHQEKITPPPSTQALCQPDLFSRPS